MVHTLTSHVRAVWWFTRRYKIPMVMRLLADNARDPSKACNYALWIDPDAFFAQPDLDYASALPKLPVWIRSAAPPSNAGARGTVADVAMSVTVERNISGVMHACPVRARARG